MLSDNKNSGGTNRVSGDSPSELRRILGILTRVIAPTTLITALLFYFGWSFTFERYRYFGVDQSVLSLSTKDYLLRSIIPAFEPLRVLLLFSLCSIWIHYGIVRLSKSKYLRFAKLLVWVIFILGIVFLIAGPVAVTYFPKMKFGTLFISSTWTLGVLLTTYGSFALFRIKRGERIEEDANSNMKIVPPWLRTVTLGIIVGLIIHGIFWTVSAYSEYVGRWSGRHIAKNITTLPTISVYSQNPLSIERPGVVEVVISDDPDAYRYRYSGLKLLLRSNDKFFILPENWTSENATAIVLNDDEKIRVEFAPGSQ